MKARRILSLGMMIFGLLSEQTFGGLEGFYNTLYGKDMGAHTTAGIIPPIRDKDYVTFIGAGAGYSNTEGMENTFYRI